MNKLFVVVLALGFAFGMLTMGCISAILQSQWRISSIAALKTVGVEVYEDAALTVPALAIDWGILEPSQSKNCSLYIINRSNVPVLLSFTTDNWQPQKAADFITLTWTYNGAELPVNTSAQVTFTLTVSQAISGINNFSFDIIVIGSG